MTTPAVVELRAIMESMAALVTGVVEPPSESDLAAVSAGYTTRREELGARTTGAAAYGARAHFYLPRDAAKVAKPLAELAAAGLLPAGDTWRILDIGAGLGSTTLGAAAAGVRLTAGELRLVDVEAVEVDGGALDVFQRLATGAKAQGLPEIRVRASGGARDLRAFEPSGQYDLVLAGLVLNELDESPEESAERLRGLVRALRPGGALIVLEPALRDISRRLHQVRDVLDATSEVSVFAPCVRSGPCPMLEDPRGWCHEDLPVKLPDAQADLARGAGLRFERLTYAYLTLRAAPENVEDALPKSPGGQTAYRVVSQPLASKGKVERRVCGAAGMVTLRRLDRHRAPANEWVGDALRGEVVRFDADAAAGKAKAVRVGAELEATRLRVIVE